MKKYLHNEKDISLKYEITILICPRFEGELIGGMDYYWAAELSLRKSMSGYLFGITTAKNKREWKRLGFQVGRIRCNAAANGYVVDALIKANKAGRKAAGLSDD